MPLSPHGLMAALIAVAGALLVVFLFADWPRGVAALVGSGVLLLSRRLPSAHVPAFVDWPLLVVGAIANLIVIDLARKSGIEIDWRAHARIGIPVTLGTLALVWVWLRWAT